MQGLCPAVALSLSSHQSWQVATRIQLTSPLSSWRAKVHTSSVPVTAVGSPLTTAPVADRTALTISARKRTPISA